LQITSNGVKGTTGRAQVFSGRIFQAVSCDLCTSEERIGSLLHSVA